MRTVSSFLVLLLAGCSGGKAPAKATDDLPRTLTVLAMNDFHGALYESPVPGQKDAPQAIGGLPWLVAAVD
jgi:hypothetical protein